MRQSGSIGRFAAGMARRPELDKWAPVELLVVKTAEVQSRG
jgi:hypothetical protein